MVNIFGKKVINEGQPTWITLGDTFLNHIYELSRIISISTNHKLVV